MSTRVALVVLSAACTNPTPVRLERPALPAEGPAITHVAPDAQDLVDRWAEAAGGRDAIRAFGALHARGSYQRGGMRGTIELWQTPRGERREEIALAPLREIRVFDGQRGWFVDRNREVRALAGFELADQLALAFVGSFAPLVTDRRAGTVTRDGDALVLAPAGGTRPVTVTLDAGHHLPVRLVRRDGEKVRTTTLSDYNRVGALRLAFSLGDTTDNPGDTVAIQWTVLEAAEPPPSAFAPPREREPDMSLATVPAIVPIEVVHGGLVFVKTEINGTPLSFVLDTGAEATVLNSSRVPALGLSALGTFATGAGGGDVVLSYVPGVTTKVGGATVADQTVAAVLLDHLEAPLGRPLDGILGYDFLSRFVVELDYAGRELRLHDRARYHHTGAGKAIPITLEDSTAFVDAAIEVPGRGSVAGHFVLDTGCLCGVKLFAPFVDSHRLLSAFPEARQAGYAAGAGGVTQALTATIPALALGGERIADLRADFSRDRQGTAADPETAGLIGALALARYVVVIDYQGQTVWLDPPR